MPQRQRNTCEDAHLKFRARSRRTLASAPSLRLSLLSFSLSFPRETPRQKISSISCKTYKVFSSVTKIHQFFQNLISALDNHHKFQISPSSFFRTMAPATTSSAEARRLIGSRRRTEAPRRMLSPSPPPKKVKSMEEILAKAHYAVVERGDYGDVGCEQCGSGERAEELLLCDKCDKGFHMKCLRPIVVRVPIGTWLCPKCSGQRRVRSRGFLFPFLLFFIF